MRERITGIISFIFGLGFGLFDLFFILKGELENESFFLLFSMLFFSTSTVLYVAWTNFGKKEFSDLEVIEYENQLIKRQIEQKELKKKLEE